MSSRCSFFLIGGVHCYWDQCDERSYIAYGGRSYLLPEKLTKVLIKVFWHE